MTKKLQGVFAPVVTTFSHQTGELDTAAFRANIEAHLAAGLAGAVVTGSTGEAALLDAAERSALVEAARAVVPKDKWLIIGTGAESTRNCLQQTRDAAKRGADAVLVVAPHYYSNAMTSPALMEHYTRVADESPVPVILYNIPKYMHYALTPTLVAELAAHKNVIGIKDSSGNKEMFASYMTSQSDSFSVITGNAQIFQHALETGARAGIIAASLFAPAIALDIYESSVKGDKAAADAAQARFTPLGATIVGELGVPGVKAALDRVGLAGGPPRLPLTPLDEDKAEMVDELLRSAELAAV